MSFVIWFGLSSVVGMALVLAIIYKLWDRSFKFKAFIGVETGEDGVTWMVDRFKVIRTKDEKFNTVLFRSRIFDRTLSPPFKYWSRFFTREKKDWDKAFKFSEGTLRMAVRRGCLFYQPQEGELFPAILTKNAEIRPMPQGNRQLLVSMIQQDAKINQDPSGRWKQVFMVVAPIVMSMILSAVIVITTLTLNADNVAAICNQAVQGSSGGFVGAVQGAVGG